MASSSLLFNLATSQTNDRPNNSSDRVLRFSTRQIVTTNQFNNIRIRNSESRCCAQERNIIQFKKVNQGGCVSINFSDEKRETELS